MTACHYLVLCFLAAHTCYAYMELDQNEQGEQIHTCEIEGMVDQNVHQLHGTLVNCQTPPMECSIDRDEYLMKSRTNIQCRLPSNDLLFYNDKACSFRFYYRRSYCFYNTRCYSLTMACLPVTNPTLFLYSLIISAVILMILLLFYVFYAVHKLCWRTKTATISKKEKKKTSLRQCSTKQNVRRPDGPSEEKKPLRAETSL